MIWKRKQPRKLTGVGATLTASHRDPRNGDVHEHTWEVKAWRAYRRDARTDQFVLEDVLKGYQGKCLPDSIAWGEDFAEWVAASINGWSGYPCSNPVIAVDVARPSEHIYARWEAA